MFSAKTGHSRTRRPFFLFFFSSNQCDQVACKGLSLFKSDRGCKGRKSGHWFCPPPLTLEMLPPSLFEGCSFSGGNILGKSFRYTVAFRPVNLE